MPKLNYLFVVNPISGGNDKSTFYRFLEEENHRQSFRYKCYSTTGTDDESKLNDLLRRYEVEVIVAVGGDGTLLLVAKVARNTKLKIGLIPFGSANGMSRELKIPKIPDIKFSLKPSDRFSECWNIIKKAHIYDVDLLQVNNKHYSLHLSDIGLNAKIVKRFEAEKIRGYFGYARLFFKELKQKKRISYQLIADGNKYIGKAYMIVIANATMYGTGSVINPIGKLNDGVFEICLIKQIKFSSLLLSIFSIFRKKIHPGKDLMKVISCKSASIKLLNAQTLQVDGEVIGEVKKLDITIIPKALRIIAN